MPEDSPAPLPRSSPPPAPGTRRPVPGWMWAMFGFGFIPVGALLGMATVHFSTDQLATTGVIGAVCGLVCGFPMLGGLALAARFSNDIGARVLLGVVFAVLLTVGLAGVLFAGCMCLTSGMRMN